MAALLTPFLVVPWRDRVAIQEPNLGWVSTWNKHPASMDPRAWQAKARDILVLVVTNGAWYLGTMVGQGAPLGKGWQCCGGLP